MSVQVEKLEKSMVKLTIEAPAEEFEAAVEKAYQKNKNKIALPGFRKGKAPRRLIEKTYGISVFYEDAANIIIPSAYEAAVEEAGVEVVAQPEIDVVDLGTGKPFVFTATVAVKPEVVLGDYKGIAVKKQPVTVTADEVMAEIKKEQEQNSTIETVTDRPVADGDVVTIDFEGFVDGAAFEGGKGEDYDLTIGSHSFIDTFETQLIGAETGADVEVNVTFPEDYQAAELAGKPALFKVKIKKIACKELPEIDDEFASEVSSFDTLKEYKDSIKEKLTNQKEEAAKQDLQQEIIDKIIAGATMEIPSQMVDSEVNRTLEDFAQRMSMQGISFEQYMQFTGSTVDQMKEQVRPQAEKRIQTRLVLEAVVRAENIEVSQDETDTELERLAMQYKMELDTVKEYFGERELANLKMDLAVTKAVDFVYDNAKITKARKKAEKKADDAAKETTAAE